MEKTKQTRKDWRDSKLVEMGAYVLVGALVLGSYRGYKLLNEQCDREFEAKYSYLVGKPKDYQLAVISSNVNEELNWWNSNFTIRDLTVRLRLKELKKLEDQVRE